jgi:hypothetical protein
VLDPAKTEQAVRVAPEHRGLTLEDLDLEAEPVVEMDVEGREHPSTVGVTGLHQPLGEFALFVVIEQGEARHRLALAVLDLVLHQLTADEVPDRLRPVAQTPAIEQFFETLQELPFDGDGDSFKRHVTPYRMVSESGRTRIPRPARNDSNLEHRRANLLAGGYTWV